MLFSLNFFSREIAIFSKLPRIYQAMVVFCHVQVILSYMRIIFEIYCYIRTILCHLGGEDCSLLVTSIFWGGSLVGKWVLSWSSRNASTFHYLHSYYVNVMSVYFHHSRLENSAPDRFSSRSKNIFFLALKTLNAFCFKSNKGIKTVFF